MKRYKYTKSRGEGMVEIHDRKHDHYYQVFAENVSLRRVVRAWRENAMILTEGGPVKFRAHQREYLVGDPDRHLCLYRCAGCRRLVCSCNGGDPDARCDDCWDRDQPKDDKEKT